MLIGLGMCHGAVLELGAESDSGTHKDWSRGGARCWPAKGTREGTLQSVEHNVQNILPVRKYKETGLG